MDVRKTIVERVRPSWPETWMKIAWTIADRSHDNRLQVGCVIVSDDNTCMLALGYNGNATGAPNVPDSHEPGLSGMIHAEINAITKCDYHLSGKKHMYVTHSPCMMCAKVIINARITKVFYAETYRDPTGLVFLEEHGVLTERVAVHRSE